MKLRARVVWVVALLVVPAAVLLAIVQHRLMRRARLDAAADAAVERMQSGGRERCEDDPRAFVRSQTPRRGRRPGATPAIDVRDPDVERGRPNRGMARRDMRGRPWMAHQPADRRQRQRRLERRRAMQAELSRRRPMHGARAFPYDAEFAPTSAQSPPLPAELVEAVRDGAAYAVRERNGQTRGTGQHELLVAMPWTDGPCAILLVRTRIPRGAPLGSMLVGVLVALMAAFVVWLAVGPIVHRIRLLTRAVADEQVDLGELLHKGGLFKSQSDEIAQLARAFARQRQEIGEQLGALRERDAAMIRYIANTTHDVMLPLTVLQGHLVAAGEAIGEGEGEAAQSLRAAIEESHYLASLLHNLNAAARLDAGAVEFVRSPVDLSALVERVVARHAQIATGRRVELVHGLPESPAWVLGDVTLLERAVSNLVHNAVRYNVAGGHVAVVLTAREGAFSLRVIDDGPGVSDEALARLGERGFRADDARTRRPTGMGLGLHIATDVSVRHGMTLRFVHTKEEDPSVGSGVTAILSGPLASRDPSTSGQDMAVPTP